MMPEVKGMAGTYMEANNKKAAGQHTTGKKKMKLMSYLYYPTFRQ
ncbi:hypothetical protein [Clostridium sp. M62/1]